MTTQDEKNLIHVEAIDMTEYQNEVETLKLKEEGYRNFLENSHGIAFQRMIKPKLQTLFTAGKFEDIIGYSNEVGKSTKSWLEHIHPDDLDWVKTESEELIGKNGYNKEFDITEIKQQEIELQKAYEMIFQQNKQLDRLTQTDTLTGLKSRRSIESFGKGLVNTSSTKNPFVMVLFDIDDFKKINDSYGHLAGDYVLEKFGRVITDTLRSEDGCGRWGGEEFLLILPETTLEYGAEIAKRLLNIVSSHMFIYESHSIHVTATAGMTAYEDGKSFRQLYSKIDEALHKGKNSGKNQVVVM